MTNETRKGFTLLELLTVIAIMAMLSTLAVSSYFGAIRGMTRRSAIKHLANTLVLARQRACMEGARVSVLIFNEVSGYEGNKETVAPTYVVCKEIGRVTHKEGQDRLYDEFTNLNKLFPVAKTEQALKRDGEFSSIRLYNLKDGRWTSVYPSVLRSSIRVALASEKGTMGEIPVYTFVKNNSIKNSNDSTWKVGDPYGIEVSAPNSLPRGFWFKELEDEVDGKPLYVTFEPDGRVSETATIRIEERLVQKSTSIKVTSDGSISYDEKWR